MPFGAQGTAHFKFVDKDGVPHDCAVVATVVRRPKNYLFDHGRWLAYTAYVDGRRHEIPYDGTQLSTAEVDAYPLRFIHMAIGLYVFRLDYGTDGVPDKGNCRIGSY